MSFFGSEDSCRDERRESIDKDECLAMVISKKCQNQKLSCDRDICQSVLEPAIEFVWMKELTFHSYYHFVNKVEIKGHQLTYYYSQMVKPNAFQKIWYAKSMIKLLYGK